MANNHIRIHMCPQPPLFSRHLSKVATTSLPGVRSNANALDNDALATVASNLDINDIRTETSLLLKEVVRAASGSLPGRATIGGDFELGDGHVGVHDLHAEPPPAGSFLVLEDNGCGDATWYDVPGDVDDTLLHLGERTEGIHVEVEVVGTASKTGVGMVVHQACSER